MIVLTGDSRGLGAEIAAALLAGGYAVTGISRSETEAVSALREEYPGRYVHLGFDLADVEAIPQLYREELKPRGPIAGLVNNAALAYDDLVATADVGELERMFGVNVIAAIVLTKCVIRDCLLHREPGSIVHVSSVSATTAIPGLAMYGATKGALEAFSGGVAQEYGTRGVRSNCVAPGFMETGMTEGLDAETVDRIVARTAMDEPTAPESVADTVSFLLSDAASSITGEVIRVDAGRP